MSRSVGVIIPSYNQGKYIEAAICSVLNNRKHIDIAIAIMDGGSYDETKEIIQKYNGQIDVWCSEKDDGQAAAINKGIRALPECQYYMWLNSDDEYESEYAVSRIYDYAVKNHLEVCYGLSHFINSKGEIVGEYPVEKYDYELLGKRCYLSQPSVMFSKKAYETVGPIDEQMKMCLDYEYWMRLAQKYRFGFVNEYIGATRVYDKTKTSTMQHQHLKEAFGILKKYYGKVPMHWVITKVMIDRPNSLFKYLPKKFLMVLFWPFRKSIIENCIEGKKDD